MNERYAVFGNPIEHSKSPAIHAAFAASVGQTIDYSKQLAPLDGFAHTIRDFIAAGGKGANVTMPFKLEAFALATHKTEQAERAGAVNALKFIGDEIHAQNFDGVGLVHDIQANLGFALKGKRVLMLGAGGAARGAVLPFLNAQPDVLVIANRTPEKAQALVAQFQGVGHLEAAALDTLGVPFDVVLNATSASVSGNCPHIAPQVFGPNTLAYDLMYGKGLTPFLRLAQQANAKQVADGVGMLVEQAAQAYAWWRGVRPQTKSVIQTMTIPLI
jgi:shikimate dehydrogenase